MRSETTEENLISEPPRNFSTRWISVVRWQIAIARAPVRSRGFRIGSG
ncbi:hypothetical protein ARTSIC4J27_4118 [Pseudarthrobacter siccitolerans]|uniref:Uncharacterized protein n=1 Tax=Pseudarthrobacter siccitolerans TaxID=861266 RepID=A0A024H8Q6_9MICC|nr:hypothetical protein ARTSIC4J27_4118 [Pseudarthrobacter siccitolerans]